MVLWKQPIDQWIGNLYGLKSGPATLPRRLVVAGKRLCVTLGIGAPVSVLDTDTGKILQTIAGTEGTEEIIHEDGLLYLVADTNELKEEFQNGPRMNYPRGRWILRKKQVLCCDLNEGNVLWSQTFDWVAPSTLSTARGKVYIFDGKQVVALSREDGSVLWKSAELPVWKEMATYYAPKLVVQGGVVMFVGGENYVPHRGSLGQVAGLSTENGKTLWTAPHPAGGYQSPEDLLVIDGKMWAANVTSGRKESPTGTGEIVALNPGSGQQEKKYDDIPAYWFHHRCYPAKATEDYLIMSRTGTEFVDLKTGRMDVAPLGTRRLFVRHHACQRPVVRPATSLLLLHRRQDVWVYRAGSRQFLAARAAAHSRRPTVERCWRCQDGVPETTGAGGGRMAHLPVRCRPERTEWPGSASRPS